MANDTTRFSRALLTILIVASVISIKMAYLYAEETLFFLLLTIAAALFIFYKKEESAR